jgi:hypothetical protein
VKEVAKGYDVVSKLKDLMTSKKEMLLNQNHEVAIKKEIEIEFMLK